MASSLRSPSQCPEVSVNAFRLERDMRMAALDAPASFFLAFNSLRGMGSPMFALLRRWHSIRMPLCSGCALLMAACLLCFPDSLLCATIAVDSAQGEQETPSAGQSTAQTQNAAPSNLETAKDWNHRLKELLNSNPSVQAVSPQEYRIGSEDVLNINVFEAQELNREVRVSASGEVSLPLLGSVRAAGLTPRELEFVIQELLHRTYMKDPH